MNDENDDGLKGGHLGCVRNSWRSRRKYQVKTHEEMRKSECPSSRALPESMDDTSTRSCGVQADDAGSLYERAWRATAQTQDEAAMNEHLCVVECAGQTCGL